MEKKKKGLIIGLMVLVLFSALYFVLKSLNLSEEETETDTATKTVFQTDAAEIAQIKLEYNGNIYTFLHENDTWSYAEDEEFPLSESSVLEFVSNVTSIESSREIEKPEALAEYGLDNPEIKITIQDKNGKSVLLEFGDDNEAVDGCYIKKDGEKSVYLVDSTLKQKFSVEIKDLAEKEEIPTLSSAAIQKVEIDKDGSVTRIKKDETSETGWTYEEIQNEKNMSSVAVDSGKVSSLMGNYSGITWQEFVSYDKNNLSAYGLNSPISVSVEYEVTETIDEESSEETKATKSGVFYICLLYTSVCQALYPRMYSMKCTVLLRDWRMKKSEEMPMLLSMIVSMQDNYIQRWSLKISKDYSPGDSLMEAQDTKKQQHRDW